MTMTRGRLVEDVRRGNGDARCGDEDLSNDGWSIDAVMSGARADGATATTTTTTHTLTTFTHINTLPPPHHATFTTISTTVITTTLTPTILPPPRSPHHAWLSVPVPLPGDARRA
ncbi:hypothetical protein BDZ89DRAFT_1160579 [Hymenopellis radicata]|nr:hypothetical protein BDZ89DRAFT_1160579 [Hymenopellis radicata]